MKIVQINATCEKGSTGSICAGISKRLNESNIDNYILYNNGKSDYANAIKYCPDVLTKFSTVFSRIIGNWGFENFLATKRLIGILNRIKPDIIHLHNVHSHGFNLTKLFKWAVANDKYIVWTFHDCWVLTGYCMHYDMINCKKWKKGCRKCPQYHAYSLLFDRSNTMQRRKQLAVKKAKLLIVTPSNWMAEQVRESNFKKYPLYVINNGINQESFYRKASDFKERNGINSKYIVLGVARWSNKKGLDVFIKLSKLLGNEYQIVLVGTNDDIDKSLPDNIVSVHKTNNKGELADIYSSADVFVNPTREEVFGLTNIEALACGTPVVTFKSGGSPECIDSSCGFVVEKDDIGDLVSKIEIICCDKPFQSADCIKRAQLFSNARMEEEYLNLYKDIILHFH